MKFPLISEGEMVYPPTGKCPVCGKDMMGDFVVLCGGALLYINKKKRMAQISRELCGFLYMTSHPKPDRLGPSLDLVDNSESGQFEFYFCSTKCLRKFLNQCVDEFEKKMKRNRK